MKNIILPILVGVGMLLIVFGAYSIHEGLGLIAVGILCISIAEAQG